MKKSKIGINLIKYTLIILMIFSVKQFALAEEAKPRFVIPQPQISLGINFSNPTCVKDDSGKEVCEINWLGEYITAIYNIALKFGGLIAAVMLMAGGVLWLVSSGDASKISQAKDILTGSVIGLTILLSSYLLLVQVNPNLINPQPLKLGVAKKTHYADTEASSGGTALPESFQEACVAAKAGNLDPCRALGNSRPEGLVNEGAVLVNLDTLNKFNIAMQCVAEKNDGKILFKINEGFRSAAGQIRIKEQFTKEGKPQNAATPCCSNHSAGIAVDLKRVDGKSMSWDYNNSSGLTVCMNSVGFYAKINNEPWHWSPSGR